MIKKIFTKALNKFKGLSDFSVNYPEPEKVIIYISGPMTGIENFNKSAFFDAVIELRSRYPKAVILNPAMLPHGLTHDEYMKICLPMTEIATHLYMLRGWEKSKGANMELDHAFKFGNLQEVIPE